MTKNPLLDEQTIAFLKEFAESIRAEIDAIQCTIDIVQKRKQISVFHEPKMMDAATEEAVSSPAKWRRGVLVPVEKFDPFGKLDRKIAYALTRLGTGDRDAILNEIHQAQPDRDKYKLENALAVRMNYLLKNGFVDAQKIGRKYQYQLLKTD
ncbi:MULTISPECIES: soluble adenylyl cyclase-like protein [Olivibacter]|uniref:Soluble adenylyl cyclase-like protein n=1 Tax=Olivibacter jilunii TaxID=985016 RepID=A0ABW6B4R5_9SPHI|nr:soluble adenylyl cyclase-like protein [Pseudosphingobacterium sp.]